MLLWLLCLLIICFRNQRSIVLFIGISTIIYLVIRCLNERQSQRISKARYDQEQKEGLAVRELLSNSYEQWQEIDGPMEFVRHPTLIYAYFHLSQVASASSPDVRAGEGLRYSIQFAQRYLQPDLKINDRREALYHCIKNLDVFIDDPSYTDTVLRYIRLVAFSHDSRVQP